mmetsp:Transcript_5804/g.9274  ORF Transcript_5804/g.9274 Transcript_5804/m.9274 type:complete len:201 (+) Transcript_5804:806-1408(+)
MEEDFCRVVSGSVESELLAGDHTGVSQRPEVNSELVIVVLAQKLIEDFRDSVDGGRLQHGIIGGVHLREIGASEGSDGAGDEDLAVVVTRDVERVCSTSNIDVVSQGGVLLSQRGQNCCQVENVVNFVLLNNIFVSLLVGHVQLIILASYRGVAFDQVSGDHLRGAEFLFKGLSQLAADLTSTSGDKDGLVFPVLAEGRS